MRRHPKHRLPMLCVTAVVALALAAGMLPAAALRKALAQSAARGDTYQTILGDAANYGIVANSFVLTSGDAQTNVAAVVGTSQTQTGNDLTNPVEQPFILSQVEGQFRIKGEPAYVRTNADDAHKVQGTGDTVVTLDTSQTASELAAEVQTMLAHGADQSAQIASTEPNADVAYDQHMQKYIVDVSGRGAGTYYVVVGEQDYAAISREPSKLQILKDADQTLVLTVPGNAEAMQKFDVNGLGADSFLDKSAGTMPQGIVWNFPNATNLNIAGSVTGVILAPQANVTVSATSSGWLMANAVTIGNGEWHNVYQGVEHLRQGSTASFEARKLVDGVGAEVSGFRFVLEQQTDAGWQEVTSAQNDGAHVSLGELVYDQSSHAQQDDVRDVVYRVREASGAIDDDGGMYVPDNNTYFAKVTVTRMVQNLPGGGTSTVYAATEPAYFADEACTQPLDGLPTFNNVSDKDGGEEPTPDPDPDPEPTPDPDPTPDPAPDPEPTPDPDPEPTPDPDPEPTPDPDHTIVIRAQKTAHDDDSMALEGATYGLWMMSDDGADTFVHNDTSDANGMLHFELPTTSEATYYLVEEDAPFGHLVDPEPTDPFTVGKDEQGHYLAYEGSDSTGVVRAAADSTNERTILDYDPANNPVANMAVHVSVGKYDRANGKALQGAELQIEDKQTGEVMATWTTDDEEYELKRELDTDRVYVLRETKAPQDYAVADEVEFRIHPEGDKTLGQILAGATTADGKKNATITSVDKTGVLHLSLFDALADVPVAGTPGSGTTTGTTSGSGNPGTASPITGTTTGITASGSKLPTTGDASRALPVAVLVVLGAVLIATGRRRART